MSSFTCLPTKMHFLLVLSFLLTPLPPPPPATFIFLQKVTGWSLQNASLIPLLLCSQGIQPLPAWASSLPGTNEQVCGLFIPCFSTCIYSLHLESFPPLFLSHKFIPVSSPTSGKPSLNPIWVPKVPSPLSFPGIPALTVSYYLLSVCCNRLSSPRWDS